MAVTFVKLVNGNVEFNNNGNKYSLPAGRVVVYPDPYNANNVIINVPEFSKFEIDWNDVTLPIGLLSRDDLYDALKNDFFFLS